MNAGHAAHAGVADLVAAIDACAGLLRRPQPLSDETVHEFRKTIKKSRALLRLLRESFGEHGYQLENTTLRDAGRCLAHARDARSLADIYLDFRERHPDAFRRLDGLAQGLQAKRATTRRGLYDSGRVPLALQALTASRERICRWQQAAAPDASTIEEGIRRIHRAGRKALRAASKDGSPEAMHELRKQVKYLANALKALHAGKGEKPAGAEACADELANILGEIHDLARLESHLGGAAGRGVDPDRKREIADLMARRLGKLGKRARSLGAKLYGEKSRCFAHELRKDAT
ncbi:MAG TPA: CHAD domain-containing protein [Burkholderiales bacterium]|nr:CHAD domain-containing protein [Burkholderiales bacterium]